MNANLRALLAFIISTAFIAACGGSDADDLSGSDGAGAASGAQNGEVVTLTIESWRSDDQAIWDDEIIPAFEAEHPGINVEFTPSPPADYNAALDTRLSGGTAGDLITCRPFDASLALFDRGDLADLTNLKGMDNFGPVAKSAWITDDGETSFCVPMASVIHGFIYNADIFDELGLTEPTNEDEFFALLETVAEDGTYIPLALGTADQWEAATVAFQNVGPNYWKGEAGRLALIDGSAKLSDQPYVDTLANLARWEPYLPQGASAVAYTDAQNLFTLGQAAIYPAGSWEITGFNENAEFDMGAFPPPPPAGQDECFISDHVDIALGMNSNTAHPAEAETFLTWVASPEFAEIYSNALPGFFSLLDAPVTVSDPLAQEFVSWRDECSSTIRNSYQILSRGEPNLEDELWAVSAGVLNGDITPDEGATRLQDGLDAWYTPGGE